MPWAARKVTLKWDDLKIQGKWRMRDLWRQKDLAVFENEFTTDVNPHGGLLAQPFQEK